MSHLRMGHLGGYLWFLLAGLPILAPGCSLNLSGLSGGPIEPDASVQTSQERDSGDAPESPTSRSVAIDDPEKTDAAVGDTADPCEDRSKWTTSAYPSHSAGHENRAAELLEPRFALDGDVSTQYSTGNYMFGGEWFQVDLADRYSVHEIRAIHRENNYPPTYTVSVSSNGRTFEEVASGAGQTGELAISVEPQAARFVRMEQTGRSGVWWNLAEFYVSCSKIPGE